VPLFSPVDSFYPATSCCSVSPVAQVSGLRCNGPVRQVAPFPSAGIPLDPAKSYTSVEFIDTNVLVYVHEGGAGAKRDPNAEPAPCSPGPSSRLVPAKPT